MLRPSRMDSLGFLPLSIQLPTSQLSKVSPKVLRWALAPLVSATTMDGGAKA